jgi:AraC-like DNA-binding protein
VDASRHSLHVGLAYLFRPEHREYFQFSRQTETHHSWCSITPKFLPRSFRRELDALPFLGVPVSESFNRILSAAFFSPPSFARTIDSLGQALFAEFLDLAHHEHGEKSVDDCVQRALRHMEDCFAEENCLAAARQAAGCSVNALIYKFTKDTGLSPSRYLWKLRAEKGAAMLAETGLTAGEIAYKCGFKNPFHFSRLIRQHHGYSPRTLRRRAWAAH